ncbi:MAG: glycosyltransferase family 39 protein [Candidatus Wallbacteria bacterium]|nr:glycosyltransferase family 39 protein [Candidatus Wallbacteria bacterium]
MSEDLPPAAHPQRNLTLVLALTLAAGLLARVSNLPLHLTRPMNSDAALFLSEARAQLAGGARLDPLWPPLYPLASALAAGPGGDLEMAALTLAVLAGTLAPLPVFLLGRRLFGPWAACFGALAVALLSPLVFWSCQAYPETLFILTLYSLLALFWVRRSDGGPGTCFVAGLLAGVAYLLRPEGFAYAPLLAGWLLADPARDATAHGRARTAAALLAGFALLAAPCLWRLHSQLGHWTVSGKTGWNLLVGDRVLGKDYDQLAWSLSSDGKEIACNRAMRELTVAQVARERPAELARRYAANVRRLLGQLADSLGWVMTALAVVGVVAAAREPAALAFLAIACAPLMALPLFFIDGRFVTLALPALVLLAARGVDHAAGVLSPSPARRRLVWTLLCAVALVPHALTATAIAMAAPQVRLAPRAGDEYRQVGLWMRQHCPAGSRTTNVWVAFHSGLTPVQIPFGGYHQTLEYLARQGCDFLVVDRRTADRGWLPESSLAFAFLLRTERPPQELEPLYRWNAQPEFEVRVYRIRREGMRL